MIGINFFLTGETAAEVKEYLDGKSLNNSIELLINTTVEKINGIKNHFSIINNEGKELIADAIIVATGFDLFKSARKEEYGYGIYDNVITSADLEGMFRKGKITLTNGKVRKQLESFIV